jgi:diguanylate cyclase (GGDEF)-like protein
MARSEFEELRRRNAELEVLFDTIRDVTSTLSVQEVVGRLLDRILVHLGSEIGSILLMGPDGWLRIMLARGLPNDVIATTRLGLGESISGYVASTGQALLVNDVENDSRFRRTNHERYYTNSFISAPISIQGAVRGVINVNNKASREAFAPGDLRLLEAIAGQAAVALGNAERYEEMMSRAQRDALTGLANHGHFWTTLEIELSRAARHGHPLSLALVDVDHFKAYNDRLGHLAGDRALAEVARQIAVRSRSHDLVARYGGEEFAVLLPETPLAGSTAFGEKIRQGVEEAAIGEAGLAVTVSVGVACAESGTTAARDLVAAADAQLYRAKSAGRNRVCSEA